MTQPTKGNPASGTPMPGLSKRAQARLAPKPYGQRPPTPGPLPLRTVAHPANDIESKKMKTQEIEKAIIEARKFIEKAEKCLQARSVSYRVQELTFHESAPKESGALRRSSMDLTRQLAEMRKP